MKHMLKISAILLSLFVYNTATALALMPVKTPLVSVSSSLGQEYLKKSTDLTDYINLTNYFVTQRTQTYCGVAAAATALNALGVESPDAPLYYPYNLFTQDNFFTPPVLNVITPAVILNKGATLEELSHTIATFDVNVETVYGSKTTAKKMRDEFKKALKDPNKIIIVNVKRSEMGEEGGGHFSPIAAYNKKHDSFLFLDVSRYKYPPVWVKTDLLFSGLSVGHDSETGKSRGYIIITKK